MEMIFCLGTSQNQPLYTGRGQTEGSFHWTQAGCGLLPRDSGGSVSLLASGQLPECHTEKAAVPSWCGSNGHEH